MYAPDTELPQDVYAQAKERMLAQFAQTEMTVEGRTRLALHQGYVEFLRAAGANEGRVWYAPRGFLAPSAVSGNSPRIESVLTAQALGDEFFFHALDATPGCVRSVEVQPVLDHPGRYRLDFNLAQLLVLPAVDPRAELEQLAQFCEVLKSLCDRHPDKKLYLLCSRDTAGDGAGGYMLELQENALDYTGSLRTAEGVQWREALEAHLRASPAVAYFFDSMATTTLKASKHHLRLDLESLFSAGEAPGVAYRRQARESLKAAGKGRKIK